MYGTSLEKINQLELRPSLSFYNLTEPKILFILKRLYSENSLLHDEESLSDTRIIICTG